MATLTFYFIAALLYFHKIVTNINLLSQPFVQREIHSYGEWRVCVIDEKHETETVFISLLF